MTARALVLAGCMVFTAAYLGVAARAEPTPVRQRLSGLPLTIDRWHGRLEPDLTKEILAILGVDDYTIRSYAAPSAPTLSLYVGYHSSQRQGDTIHSPLNCLPGAGWIPVELGRVTLYVRRSDGQPRAINVNRVIIEKGLDRYLVLYWYQSHGRVVASEYWGKVYTVVDAIRYNRTDAALVRVMAPLDSDHPEAATRAEAEATSFVQAMFPLLGRYLPE